MNTQSDFTRQLFDSVNFITENIRTAENIYKDFLRWSGLFINDQGDGKRYSIANQLLIYGYNNHARLVRNEDEWKHMGVSVIKPEQQIYILKKNETGYETRTVYDISSTNAQQLKLINGRDWGSKCEALIASAPCQIKFNSQLGNQRMNYIQKDNIITAGKGFVSYENIFASLSQEYAHFHICGEMKKRFDIEIDKKMKEAAAPVMREAFYKSVEGKFYELSPGEPIRKDREGRLFILEQDRDGKLYKVHVEKKLVEEPQKEVRKPEFRYSRNSCQHMAYAVSCLTGTAAGIDQGAYSFSNEAWKKKKLPEIRDELDIITDAGRKILLDYNEALFRQGNAVYEDFQNKTEQVNQAESEVV